MDVSMGKPMEPKVNMNGWEIPWIYAWQKPWSSKFNFLMLVAGNIKTNIYLDIFRVYSQYFLNSFGQTCWNVRKCSRIDDNA